MPTDVRRLLEDLALAESIGQGAEIKERLGRIEDAAQQDRAERALERQVAQDIEAAQAAVSKADRFRKLADEAFEKGEYQDAAEHYNVAARTYPVGYVLGDNGLRGQGFCAYRAAVSLFEMGAVGLALDIFEGLAQVPQAVSDDVDELRVFAKEFDARYREACEFAISGTEGMEDPRAETLSKRGAEILARLGQGGDGALAASIERMAEARKGVEGQLAELNEMTTRAEALVAERDRIHESNGLKLLGSVALTWVLGASGCMIGAKLSHTPAIQWAGHVVFFAIPVAIVTRIVLYLPSSPWGKANAAVKNALAEIESRKAGLDGTPVA